ncbi:MAG: hypothetical protein ABI036_19115 [Fibrobacteria bacterium]
MRSERHLGLRTRRLLLGGFLLYLFGLLGYLGPAHKHVNALGHAHGDLECQLCQATAQAYAAPVPLSAPLLLAMSAPVGEAVWHPVLAFRFEPFSSRAPPCA